MAQLEKPQRTDDDMSQRKIMIASLMALVVVVGSWLLYLRWAVGNDVTPGVFGDSFGALGTLFSGLAFAALVITLLMQREQLRLQNADLRATHLELKRSAEAHVSTQKALNEQVMLAGFANRAQCYASIVQASYYCAQQGGDPNRDLPREMTDRMAKLREVENQLEAAVLREPEGTG